MRPALATILIICWMHIGIYPAKCNNPEVSRQRMLIYRIAEEDDVDVVQCKYYDHKHPALTYFDITRNCVTTPKTGIFVDKWEERNTINAPVSFVDMKQYKAKADLVRNEIKLRSGTICRYDRGFCYDSKENENYAAVWEVKRRTNKPVDSCPENLEQLFYGPVDIWEFPEKNLQYLVFSDNRGNAFYLKLMEKIYCHNIETWITEGDSFLVTSLKLKPALKDTSILNQHYFPLKSLKLVSEAIMKNVELQEYPLDFNNQMSTVYFEEPDNTRILYHKLREEIKFQIKSVSENINGGPSNLILVEIDDLKRSIVRKTEEIKNILNKLELTKADLRVTKNDVSNFQKLIDSFSQTYNKDIVNFKITLTALNNNIYSESQRISELLSARNVEFIQKIEQLNSFMKNQVNNLSSKSDLAGKLSELKLEMYKLLNEQNNQLNIILKKTGKFEHSLNSLRNENIDLKKGFEIAKGEYGSKLNLLEQRLNENFGSVRNDFTEVLELISKKNGSSETDSKIADLRKYIDDFIIRSKSDSESSFSNIRETIKTFSQNSITKKEFFNLQTQIDNMNRNIADVEWEILKNITNNPISSEYFNNEMSSLRVSVKRNIDQLKQELSKKLAQHESRCNCNEEINKMVENFKKSLAAAQHDILQKTNSLVETTKKEITSQLTGEVIILRGQIDINKGQLIEIITHRLQEKEKQIEQLERTLSAQIEKLQQKTDEVSRNLTTVINDSQIRPIES